MAADEREKKAAVRVRPRSSASYVGKPEQLKIGASCGSMQIRYNQARQHLKATARFEHICWL